MNLEEALLTLEVQEIKTIAKELEVHIEDNFTKRWYVIKVCEKLLNFSYLMNTVFPKMSNDSLNSLFKFVFTGVPPKNENRKELSKFGCMVNNTVPEDLFSVLWQNGRSLVVSELPDIKHRFTPSYFLRCIQLLLYMKEEKVIHETKKRFVKELNKIEQALFITNNDSNMIRRLFSYLISEKLVLRENKKLYFNENIFSQWKLEESHERLKRYYNYQADSYNIFELLSTIGKLQDRREEWVRLAYVPSITLGPEKAQTLGLARYVTYNGKMYIQLTPEGWFLIKGETPLEWLDNNFIVSADFELFIPHTSNPLLILDLYPFCTLKENDYFMVYDMNIFDENLFITHQKKYRYFYNMLKKRSRYIPEVVKYEFETKFN
ncbi:hypothetical protein [Bacillus sp. FJAT-29814]|uniref:hypothetical protein n=1 Tax=Bacillus sp. FJAT-29814 TaxID=1729688 RepID=UPI0008363F98|nr:hypothetical protein [Bacillus sp. FJAT-29814]